MGVLGFVDRLRDKIRRRRQAAEVAEAIFRPGEEEPLCAELIGGPLDGGFEFIDRSQLAYGPGGVIWRLRWRFQSTALYEFSTPPEPICYCGKWFSCFAGRFAGWE